MYIEGNVAKPRDSKTVFLEKVNFELRHNAEGVARRRREAEGGGSILCSSWRCRRALGIRATTASGRPPCLEHCRAWGSVVAKYLGQ